MDQQQTTTPHKQTDTHKPETIWTYTIPTSTVADADTPTSTHTRTHKAVERPKPQKARHTPASGLPPSRSPLSRSHSPTTRPSNARVNFNFGSRTQTGRHHSVHPTSGPETDLSASARAATGSPHGAMQLHNIPPGVHVPAIPPTYFIQPYPPRPGAAVPTALRARRLGIQHGPGHITRTSRPTTNNPRTRTTHGPDYATHSSAPYRPSHQSTPPGYHTGPPKQGVAVRRDPADLRGNLVHGMEGSFTSSNTAEPAFRLRPANIITDTDTSATEPEPDAKQGDSPPSSPSSSDLSENAGDVLNEIHNG